MQEQSWFDFVKCTCPKKCDCENPPPDDWDGKNGIFHVSNECPKHNLYPEPNPECPFHGEMTVIEFSLCSG